MKLDGTPVEAAEGEAQFIQMGRSLELGQSHPALQVLNLRMEDVGAVQGKEEHQPDGDFHDQRPRGEMSVEKNQQEGTQGNRAPNHRPTVHRREEDADVTPRLLLRQPAKGDGRDDECK